jgi:hypothetical protein
MAPGDLVKLSPNELATDEQKDARDAESKASTMERRADYYQIARAGIQVISFIAAFSSSYLFTEGYISMRNYSSMNGSKS